MNQSETNLVRDIMLALGKLPNIRIFRNNTGTGWIGQSKRFTKPQTVNVKTGDVLIQNARVFHAGLCTGSSDLIGLQSVIVTPDMVGQQVAIFAAVEVKTESGRASQEQINFIETINSMGGVGVIIRTPQEAVSALNHP